MKKQNIAYKERKKEVNDLLEQIKAKMKQHEKRFKKSPEDWGYVRNLSDTVYGLERILKNCF